MKQTGNLGKTCQSPKLTATNTQELGSNTAESLRVEQALFPQKRKVPA